VNCSPAARPTRADLQFTRWTSRRGRGATPRRALGDRTSTTHHATPLGSLSKPVGHTNWWRPSPLRGDSWVTPMDMRRVRSEGDANDVAAGQVRELVGQLPAEDATPLFVLDAGYNPVRLQLALESCRAQILVRLHSGRNFYAPPEPPPRRPVGRPFRHGAKFSCKNPSTWPDPTAEHHARSAGYGEVRVRAWSGLYPKSQRAKERYGVEGAAVVVRAG